MPRPIKEISDDLALVIEQLQGDVNTLSDGIVALNGNVGAHGDELIALKADTVALKASSMAHTNALNNHEGRLLELEGATPEPQPEPEPEPEPEPPLPPDPGAERQYIQPIWMRGNSPNSPYWNASLGVMVFENLEIHGRFTLVDMPGVIVRNVKVVGNEDSKRADDTYEWGHLNLRNCPHAIVEDYISEANLRGHGIHLTDDCSGIEIYRADCRGAEEDGIQTAPTAFTAAGQPIKVYDSTFVGNHENGVDLKGSARINFYRCLIDTLPGPHEPFLTHRNFVHSVIDNCTIVDSDANKALGSINSGFVAVVNTTFSCDWTDRGFRQGADQLTIQQMVDGITRPWGSFTSCSRVPQS